jgi:hypothetical protein
MSAYAAEGGIEEMKNQPQSAGAPMRPSSWLIWLDGDDTQLPADDESESQGDKED